MPGKDELNGNTPCAVGKFILRIKECEKLTRNVEHRNAKQPVKTVAIP
jgi:hypothetical protein